MKDFEKMPKKGWKKEIDCRIDDLSRGAGGHLELALAFKEENK